MRKFFTLLLMAIMAVGYSWAAEETFDFVGWKFDGASSWGSTYGTHVVNGEVFKVTFTNASKQSGTVTDCPVLNQSSKSKKGQIDVVFGSSDASTDAKITGVEIVFKQWGSKTNTAELFGSQNGTTGYTTITKHTDMKTSFVVSEATLLKPFDDSKKDLGIKALRVQFGNVNQVGIASIKITYTTGDEPEKTETKLSFGAEVDGQTLMMKEGETKTTAATLSPTIDGAVIAYNSSNSVVATISEAGVVNALAEGTTTITANYAGDNTYKASAATYTLNVVSAKYVPTLTFAEAEVNKVFGDKFTQIATLENAEGAPEFTDKTIKYSSSDTDIATVDEQTGEVTVKLTEGTATITANYAGDDNHKAATASYTLKVTEKLPDGAIVFSDSFGSFDNFAKGSYTATSPTAMRASDNKDYTWTWVNGGLMRSSQSELQVKSGTTISSPMEFNDFGGYTVILTYRFGSASATFNFEVGETSTKLSANGQTGTYKATFEVGDGQEFKIVNGSSNALYISGIVIVPNTPKMTLKEATACKKRGSVTISDNGIRVVKQIKRKGADTYLLVVKDADGEAVDAATVAGEPYNISYTNGGETVVAKQEEYSQSNWLIVEVDGTDADYENKMLKSVKGVLTNDGSLQMLAADGKFPEVVIGDEVAEEYLPNAYTPVNFMVAAGSNTIKADDGKNYFFMNPKRGEYVKIVDAVYQSGKFYIPAKEGSINHYGFEGAFALDDTYQDIPVGLEEGKFYSFDAIVIGLDAADKVAANDNSAVSQLYKVAPVNLVNNPVTAVDGVAVNREVVGVTYYNVAGVASSKPFDGVNIVVTKYADGSTKATKQLK